LESEIFPEGEPGGEFTEGLSATVIKAESHADTQALLDAAHMEAERIIDTAKASASKIESDAAAKADSIMEEARNKGYESGYSEGMTKAAQEMQDMREALDKEKEELEELYQKRLNDMEPELVDTITDVYEHILKTDLKIHKTIAGHLVANALRNIEGARSFFIHISKDNYDYVNSRKGVLEEAVKVPGSIIEIMEDISLPPDSCMIETDGGIFDCSLGTELSELSTKLKMLSYSRDDSNN
jgi:flagellar assembly protein FliH